MSFLQYFLVHNGQLVWTRSGHRPAMYDTAETARKWSTHHTTDYERGPDGKYHRLPVAVAARILEFAIDGDNVSTRWVE